MGLKLKTFNEILNSMANWVHSHSDRLTNFRVGSVVRTLLEAVSVEIESLYFQMYNLFIKGTENAVYNSFNFYKFPATKSSGEVTIVFRSEVDQRTIIPSGFKFSTTPINGVAVTFETTSDVAVPLGTVQLQVPVQCTQEGEIGNVPAYSIRRMVSPITVISDVYNSHAILNGAPEEGKEERKKRFNKYINTLARGTISAIEYGCLKVTGVTGAYVEEDICEITVYVHNASGDLPKELENEVYKSLVDYKSAGIGLVLKPVIKVPVDVHLTVHLKQEFDSEVYRNLIQTSVTSFLNYFSVAKSLIRAELIAYIMGIDTNAITNVELDLERDISATGYKLIRAGVITVSVVQEVQVYEAHGHTKSNI